MKILFVGAANRVLEMTRINSSEELEMISLSNPLNNFHDLLGSTELCTKLKEADFVIFQQTNHNIYSDMLLNDAKALIKLARSYGSVPYIIIPNGQRNTDDFNNIKEIYHQIMMDNLVDGIPVGYVINDISKNNRELELYETNNTLSLIGDYLVSVVILCTIFFAIEFPGKLFDQIQYTQLDEKLNAYLINEMTQIVAKFKNNYCVCGKRELLDD